jgi:hypothetical protein
MEREFGLYTPDGYESREEIMKKINKKESLSGGNTERHLFIGDTQIPDQNEKAVSLVMDFIKDYKPDVVHHVGDLMNFDRISKYKVLHTNRVTSVKEELEESREFLANLQRTVRKYKPKAQINYLEGNHEMRLRKYLASNAPELTEITDSKGECVLSLPHLLGLKDLGINWFNYYDKYQIGPINVEHGDIARSKSGYTAQGMLEKRWGSGVSGHTHRLAFVTRRAGDQENFWIEAGSLCGLEPSTHYTKQPDWVNGFAIGLYDKKEKIMHPATILIQKDQFYYNEKIYKA